MTIDVNLQEDSIEVAITESVIATEIVESEVAVEVVENEVYVEIEENQITVEFPWPTMVREVVQWSTFEYYEGWDLEIITYDNGQIKTMIYTEWVLTTIVRDRLINVVTKTFAYNEQGELISVTVS